jgi:hypothetical protein
MRSMNEDELKIIGLMEKIRESVLLLEDMVKESVVRGLKDEM